MKFRDMILNFEFHIIICIIMLMFLYVLQIVNMNN